MECPICKKEFNEYTGRRAKKFCSDECKVKFWNAQKKVIENNKPENKERIMKERNGANDKLDEAVRKYTSFGSASEFTEFKTVIDNSEKINQLEEEYKTVPDVGMGKKLRASIQNKIYKLKQQLTNK